MAIKIKISKSSIRLAERQTKDLLQAIIKDKDLLNEIGTNAVEDIKFQTRRGRSIPKGEEKFKALSPSWSEFRKKTEFKSNLSDVFAPRRSNLSLSGQLIDSIKHKITSQNTILIEADGIRDPYRYVSKRTGEIKEIKSRIDNKELSKFVSIDRPFIGIRERVQIRITRLAQAFIRRALRPRS